MSDTLETFIRSTCRQNVSDRGRLMDILTGVQSEFGCISGRALDLIARELKIPRVDVQSTASFYSFFSEKPKGRIVIRLCDDVIDEMAGSHSVATALVHSLGIGFGQTTPDGRITLEKTACIGMSDQAPAAMVNDVILTNLDGCKARLIVDALKGGAAPHDLVHTCGDGNNSHELVRAMVNNNIRRRGPVILDTFEPGAGLRKAVAMTPAEVIRDIKTARLRGRGGAGFPTGMKWEFTRAAGGDRRFILCNADEGEPGTFKDRVVLTECPALLFEGMTIGGYAIGAKEGILYLRAEYAYLRNFLENVLNEQRSAGLLGRNILGKPGFDFDIRIQMGAGAYVCGEETALISSCEGLRGDPKNRPPFPAQKGYLGCPTSVNNVETLCCVARILDRGPGWFAQMGSKGSPGTKLLSVSGDCHNPGTFEVPFGISLGDLLKLAGADRPAFVQVGGPSGQMVGPSDFNRIICYDDLATGGSIMVFGPQRKPLEVARKFMDFFIHESCGYCTPCRVGNILLKNKLDDILGGRGEEADIPYLNELCRTVKLTSRCGLGQTSPNPVASTLKSFREEYEKGFRKKSGDGFRASFDIKAALKDTEELAGRKSEIF